MPSLFENENIIINKDASDDIGEIDHDKANEKYTKGDVRIVTEQGRFQLTTVPSIVESEDYILDPEFQRRHRWSEEKKSRLIESFIMNVPVPPIFLYEIEFSVYEVMDGLQRLTALYEFYSDKFRLEGLEEWRELNGLTYSQLPSQIKRGIDRRYLSSMILLKETAKSEAEAQRLKQLVFERINSGGEQLEDQEKRNALYNGKLNKLCIELSRNKYFCRMWGIPEQTQEELEGNPPKELTENTLFRKMYDVELVLRFFAFRHLEQWDRLTLKRFLDLFLQKGNLFDNTVVENYRVLFEETSEFVFNLLGEDAFCLYRVRNGKWAVYNRPTKVVFDPLMYVLSNHLVDKERLLDRTEDIKLDILEFYKINYEQFGGRNTGKQDVFTRIQLFDAFIMKYL